MAVLWKAGPGWRKEITSGVALVPSAYVPASWIRGVKSDTLNPSTMMVLPPPGPETTEPDVQGLTFLKPRTKINSLL